MWGKWKAGYNPKNAEVRTTHINRIQAKLGARVNTTSKDEDLAMGNGYCCDYRNEPGTQAEESARQRSKELLKEEDSIDDEESTDKVLTNPPQGQTQMRMKELQDELKRLSQLVPPPPGMTPKDKVTKAMREQQRRDPKKWTCPISKWFTALEYCTKLPEYEALEAQKYSVSMYVS